MLLAPVNPADLLAIEGRYAGFGDRPEIIGAEGLGVVEEVGPEVSGGLVGSRVIPLSRGNWASHRILSVGNFVMVPSWLDDTQAAVLRINPATSALLLGALSLRPGDTLVQNASRSSVARFVRLLAAQDGVETASVDDVADAGAHGALDAVAGAATGELSARLRPGGRLIVYGHLSGEPCVIASSLLTGRGLTVEGFSLRRAEAGRDAEATQRFYAGLAEILRAHPEPIEMSLPLSALGDALQAARRRGRSGRVLLSLQD